jgi:thymidine phosphorylase
MATPRTTSNTQLGLAAGYLLSAKTGEEVLNEQAVRSLYSLAESNSEDTTRFVSQFTRRRLVGPELFIL